MGKTIQKFKPLVFVMLITSVWLLLAAGCARYAHDVNTLYEPVATIRGGSGEVYIVIPEERQTRSTGFRWVLGTVMNDDNERIDEVLSTRSPAEIIQEAFSQELTKAGYTALPVTTRPADKKWVIDLSKAEIKLDQITDIADLKATCRIIAGVDLYRSGTQIKRLQYEATSAQTDIKDRDLLARNVLNDALQLVMLKAMPELHGLLKE
jgi:hypothetical protein